MPSCSRVEVRAFRGVAVGVSHAYDVLSRHALRIEVSTNWPSPVRSRW